MQFYYIFIVLSISKWITLASSINSQARSWSTQMNPKVQSNLILLCQRNYHIISESGYELLFHADPYMCQKFKKNSGILKKSGMVRWTPKDPKQQF